MFAKIGTTAAVLFCCLTVASAQDLPPPHVKICEGVRTYIGSDNTMTMDKFKELMRAANGDLGARGEAALDNQCKATAYAKHVVMSQGVFTKDDGTPVRISTEIISDGGVCRLTKISVEGC